MNPRYLAYCAANGFPADPAGMRAYDRKAWPGGAMAGFTLWMMPIISEFNQLHGAHSTVAHPERFTEFVASRIET